MSLSNNYPTTAPSLSLDFANTGKLDPRITFSRASTATYYDGVTTAKAEENLASYSQDFSNAYWTKSNITVTADSATAPDGTTTADSIVTSATAAICVIYNGTATLGVAGQPITISVFAKANTASYLQLYVPTGMLSGGYANFDLATGVVGTLAGTGLTSNIVSVGSGWYRCIVSVASVTAATVGSAQMILVDSASSARGSTYTGTIGNSLYLWGAQVEQRSTVTAYTATTTAPITNYIPVLMTAASNVARFDHTPTTGAALGLLIEESRTNVTTYSEQFDNASWVKTALTVTANSNVAPNGTLSADTLVEDTTATGHVISASSFTFAATTAYTASVYVKQAGRSWVFIQLATTPFGATTRAWFDLANGVVGTQANCTGSIRAVGNGWYRCSVTATTTVGGVGNPPFTVQMATADNTTTYTGNGYSGIYIWGAQLEAGAFATSYIPTVASTVQRQADVAVMTGTNFSSWYNPSEGTLYAEYNHATTSTNNPAALSINANVNSNEIVIYGEAAVGEKFFVREGGAIQATITASAKFSTGVTGKLAGAYKANDFAASANGAAAVVDTSGSIPTVTQMNIGNEYNGSLPLNGTIKSLAYYPVRLTNAQLQAMTS